MHPPYIGYRLKKLVFGQIIDNAGGVDKRLLSQTDNFKVFDCNDQFSRLAKARWL